MLDIIDEMDFADELQVMIVDLSNIVMDEAFKRFDAWLS